MKIQLARLGELLAARRIDLWVAPKAEREIAQRGYDPAYGARPLKRVIQREIQNALAMKLLSGEVREGDSVLVDFDDEVFVFTATPTEQGEEE